MSRYKIIIPRAEIAPIQVFAVNRTEAIDLAKTYLGFLPAGHIAHVYELKDELEVSLLSCSGEKGYEFKEITLDSSLKVVETKEESKTPERKETQEGGNNA